MTVNALAGGELTVLLMFFHSPGIAVHFRQLAGVATGSVPGATKAGDSAIAMVEHRGAFWS